MKFSIKDLFSKCDQIRRKLRIRPHLRKKFLMENFIFCAVISVEPFLNKKYLQSYLLVITRCKVQNDK